MTFEIASLNEQRLVNAFKNGEIRVCVVGLGRIGLPTATAFAAAGASVVGIDINAQAVHQVNAGKCYFKDEPKLGKLLKKVVAEGKLAATMDYSTGVSKADIIIVCVPTVGETNNPDYSALLDACRNIAEHMKRKCLFLIESTIGISVVEDTVIPLLEGVSGMRAGKDFDVASCPERANPGEIFRNFETVPRVVGGISQKSTEKAAIVYRIVFSVPIIKVRDPKTANAIKLIENTFRDVNIALMNELALLCEKLGVDIIEVLKGCATKWNFIPHYPGAGVGGGCIPASSFFLISQATKSGGSLKVIRAARNVNDNMPNHVVALIEESLALLEKSISGSKIAVLGITYKPNVRDLRRTPILSICTRLQEKGAMVAIYDPFFRGEVVEELRIRKTLNGAIEGADCILLGTVHESFKNLELHELARKCSMPAAFIDSRNFMNPIEVAGYGFLYRGIGRSIEMSSDSERKKTSKRCGK